MTPKEFFDFCKKSNAEMVDLKFCDLLGTWQHCSFPIDVLDEGTFVDGLGFDGSSIRCWQGIHQSDMLAVPDPDTAVVDSFYAKPTVSVIADIVDPVSKEKYTRDPRHIAKKAEAFSSLRAGRGFCLRAAGLLSASRCNRRCRRACSTRRLPCGRPAFPRLWRGGPPSGG